MCAAAHIMTTPTSSPQVKQVKVFKVTIRKFRSTVQDIKRLVIACRWWCSVDGQFTEGLVHRFARWFLALVVVIIIRTGAMKQSLSKLISLDIGLKCLYKHMSARAFPRMENKTQNSSKT